MMSRLPLTATIPHSRPTVGPDEAEAVAAVVRSGQLAQGARVSAFEEAVARGVGARGGVAVSSGTAGLYLALRALGVGAGDEVLIPSYVCAALFHAVAMAGATSVLVDVEGTTLAMDPADARRRVTPRTRAVIFVHPFGRAVAPSPFLELGPPVIEDCCQAIGAEWGGRPAGGFGQM